MTTGPSSRFIATTTTAKGLAVTRRLGRRRFPVGGKVSDERLASVYLAPEGFDGGQNYTIQPKGSATCKCHLLTQP